MSESWHPILAAQEDPVGTWRLVDPDGRRYALIELRRLDGQPRYRVTVGEDVLGYARTLKMACEYGHRAYVRSHFPGTGANEYR